MDTFLLRNGTEEVEPLVVTVMTSLRLIFERQPIAFYELVMFCRDDRHRLFGTSGDELVRRGLLDSDGSDGFRVHDSIRNIVLSAADGEGLEMTLINPVAEGR